ncbi:hypothetical protein EDD18DRAFT_1360975 [Armillaria luteobubalina]|uniref:Uncharacterized protein n=1 Tax=Armillaria luteobubalina TaxID=153913 RepID=A0AA39PLR0_9AGAR|nr:hypothetical protein EDD18DRAFT_1360975 [Armillaria luteobubalina]
MSLPRELFDQLSRRLVFQFVVANASEDAAQASQFRKYAILTYLAPAMVRRITSVWSEEVPEQETSLLVDLKNLTESHYTAYTSVLQSSTEKVAVFRFATKYVDSDLRQQSDINLQAFEFPRPLLRVRESAFVAGDNTGPGSAIRERLPRMKSEPAGMNTIKIDRKALPAQPSLHTA